MLRFCFVFADFNSPEIARGLYSGPTSPRKTRFGVIIGLCKAVGWERFGCIIQPRGVFLSRRITEILKELLPSVSIPYGELNATFFRDDFRMHDSPIQANQTRIDFLIEHKRVILIDDVLYTGRTVRAALDAMLGYGRPISVELLVLVDRKH